MEKSTFGIRLSKILQEKGVTRKALAIDANISEQSIGNYINEKRKPDCDIISQIAIALNVSSDYLLGLSEVPTRNETIQGIHQKTGLWEDSIAALMTEVVCKDYELCDFISYLVVNSRTSQLIAAIKSMNQFIDDPKSATLYVEGKDYHTDMKSLFKMVVIDLFFEIIDGYTAGPGERVIGYKEGKDNG